MFVSQVSAEPNPDSSTIDRYNLKKRVEAVMGCRDLEKGDMKFNQATPNMEVDPETFVSVYPPPFLFLPSTFLSIFLCTYF